MVRDYNTTSAYSYMEPEVETLTCHKSYAIQVVLPYYA